MVVTDMSYHSFIFASYHNGLSHQTSICAVQKGPATCTWNELIMMPQYSIF